MNKYGVVLFYTISACIRAEKMLIKAGVVVKLITTPRELSSDCGISLRFEWSQAEHIKALLEAERIDIAGIHPIEG